MKKHSRLKISLAVLVSFLSFLLLVKLIDFGDIKLAFSKLSLTVLFISFFIYYFTYLFRALRLKLLLGDTLGFFDLFNIISVHEMFAQILPFRLGEATFVLLTKKISKIQTHSIFSAYIIFRFFDVFAIVFIFAITLFFLSHLTIIPFSLTISAIVLLSFFVFLVIWFLFFNEKTLAFLNNNVKFNSHKKIKYHFFEMIKSLNTIKNLRTISMLFILSIFVWIFHFYVVFYFLTVFGLCLSFSKIILISSAVAFSALIPIPNISGIGTTDAIWVTLLVLIGAEKSLAISSIILTHALSVLFYIILGIFGLAYLYLQLREK